MKNKKIALVILIIFGLGLFLSNNKVVSAAIVDPEATEYKDGTYGVDDIVALASNISKIILELVGSLTLLMFIYGGYRFLISGGSSESIDKGKKAITAASVGLIIVLSNFVILKFVLDPIGVTTEDITPSKKNDLCGTKTNKTNSKAYQANPENYACMDTGGDETKKKVCIQNLCLAQKKNFLCCPKVVEQCGEGKLFQYACLKKIDRGSECKDNLCKENNEKCCMPSSVYENNCKKVGAKFVCMNKNNGKNCESGKCPSDENFLCCEPN